MTVSKQIEKRNFYIRTHKGFRNFCLKFLIMNILAWENVGSTAFPIAAFCQLSVLIMFFFYNKSI